MMREALVVAMRDRWPEVSLAECGDFPAAWLLADTQPDFCLVDLSMPGAGPVEGVRGLRERAPGAAIIVVTGLESEPVLEVVRDCGIAGLHSKNMDADHLLHAISLLVPGLQAMEARRLPPRQSQVLALMAEGLTNKQIALRLGISPATVKIHVARLTGWLGATNRTDAVMRARQGRLI